MSRFRPSRRRSVPGLNVAAMPDLIFTVLFFFMIVTHMRDVQPRVRYEVPQGSEVEKASKKGGVVYIFIGRPVDEQGNVVSDKPVIQLNDRYVSVEEMAAEINRLRAQMNAYDRQNLIVSLRADRDTEMGVISDVKQALRQAGALRINYSATASHNRQKHN